MFSTFINKQINTSRDKSILSVYERQISTCRLCFYNYTLLHDIDRTLFIHGYQSNIITYTFPEPLTIASITSIAHGNDAFGKIFFIIFFYVIQQVVVVYHNGEWFGNTLVCRWWGGGYSCGNQFVHICISSAIHYLKYLPSNLIDAHTLRFASESLLETMRSKVSRELSHRHWKIQRFVRLSTYQLDLKPHCLASPKADILHKGASGPAWSLRIFHRRGSSR